MYIEFVMYVSLSFGYDVVLYYLCFMDISKIDDISNEYYIHSLIDLSRYKSENYSSQENLMYTNGILYTVCCILYKEKGII